MSVWGYFYHASSWIYLFRIPCRVALIFMQDANTQVTKSEMRRADHVSDGTSISHLALERSQIKRQASFKCQHERRWHIWMGS